MGEFSSWERGKMAKVYHRKFGIDVLFQGSRDQLSRSRFVCTVKENALEAFQRARECSMNRNDEKALKNKKRGGGGKDERKKKEERKRKKQQKERKGRKSGNHGNGFTFFHQFFFDRLPLDTSTKCISYLSDVSREKEISADLLKETKIPVSIFHNTGRPPFVPVTYYPSMLGKFTFTSFLSRLKFHAFYVASSR